MASSSFFRVVSFDCGNHYTGVVVADVRPGDFFEIVHMKLIVDTSKNKEELFAGIEAEIDPFVKYIQNKCFACLQLAGGAPNGTRRLGQVRKEILAPPCCSALLLRAHKCLSPC